MSRNILWSVMSVSCAVLAAVHLGAQTPSTLSTLNQLPRLEEAPAFSGPPLSLGDAIDEALRNNPALVVLRRELDSARQRPAQERFLPPPTLSAQIWQWPINTLDPRKTNMYMLTIEQEIPG